MKQSLLLVLFCLRLFLGYAQQDTYERRWQSVDSLMNKRGLTASALTEVNSIYSSARREKNEGQAIKALLYRLTLEQKKSEEGFPSAIRDLTKQVDSSSGAVKAILENMLAGLYASYLRENSWKFARRTEINQRSERDIDSWSIADFHRTITELYLRSLAPEQMLTQIDLKKYRPIILEGKSPWLRPTLWDLLAHRALDDFKTGPGLQVISQHPFVFEDAALFGEAAFFLQYRPVSPDSLDNQYLAIRLFQRLIRLHLADTRPDALIAVDVERLNFVQAHYTGEKDEDYLQALARITDRYPASPATAEAWYYQANRHYLDGVSADAPIDSNGCVKARAICEKVNSMTDSSEGKDLCNQLLQTILRKEVTLQMEKVHIPAKPFPVLVSWQNLNLLYLRIVKVDDNRFSEMMTKAVYDSANLNGLLSAVAYRAFTQELPDPGDLRRHSTEIAVGSLPPGGYALLTSSDSGWSRKRGVMGLQYFTLSAIAYVNNGNDYFVVNRETGKPIAGAKAQFLRITYSSKGREATKAVAVYTTDVEGHFVKNIRPTDVGFGADLDISIPGDRLWPVQSEYIQVATDDTVVIRDKNKYEEEKASCDFFSDRSIYRPGQTIYFKGIATTEDFDTHRSKPYTGQGTTVTLFDANSQVVDTMRLTTNEFGSFHGSFKLPEGRLNGMYILRNSMNGNLEFSVEEYKRPKFYVDYDKQVGDYRAGDSIRVTGMAKGYAGNGVGGGGVRYRVVRKTRYPYLWMFWRGRPSFQADQEIASGTIRTDAGGRFSFVFLATPDRRAERRYNPEFDFQVSADVTDIGGETRSATTEIVAGYTAVKLSLDLPGGERMPADSLEAVQVGASNLAGTPVAAEVRVTIYPLQAPQRLVRERLWDAPDLYAVSEKEWLDSFPHDEYRRETQKESWPRGVKIWDTLGRLPGVAGTDGQPGSRRNEAGQLRLAIPHGVLVPGWYVVEVETKDKYGQEVKDRRYVELYDGKTGAPANPRYSWGSADVDAVEPGEKAQTSLGTSVRDVYVIRSIERSEQKRFSNFMLNGGSKQTEWAIAESDRGGFAVSDVFVKDNRVYTHLSLVHVPWTNKELDIHYTTYRDKTEPGSAEKWQLTISGHRGEKVAAEVLSTLYDASLDQFMPHSWPNPTFFPSVGAAEDWNSGGNFNVDVSQFLNFDRVKPSYSGQYYSELMEPLAESRVVIGYGGRRLREAVPMAMVKGRVGGEMLVRGAVMDLERSDSLIYRIKGSSGQAIKSQPRTDFRETAFFFPDLRTDTAGNVSFSFTMPEALTTWKWMTLASTRDLAFGYSERTVVTQKKLMVEPNAPRFLREGDKIELPVKVINMTDSELTGQMSLQLTDPTTGQTADGWFVNRQPNQYFTVGPRRSAVVAFPLDIPYQYNRPLTYKVVAEAKGYSDGEEATLPVVSNRLLVTESLPLNMPGEGTKHFTFDKLLKSGSSETLNNHALTVEFTANPAWYAVQSLPYLVEHGNECSEQVFSRVYANALASRIASSSPRLQEVFARWRDEDTTQLLSNLQKNEELKTVLLAETPWVLEGKTESQQKKAVAMLFDMGRMSKALEAAVDKLAGMQLPDGSFPWFTGGPGDRYITQYIVTGIGHLLRLQAVPAAVSGKMNAIVKTALPWLDGWLVRDYKAGLNGGKPGLRGAAWIGPFEIQYLYMRSFFNETGIPGNVLPAMTYYRKKAQTDWLQQNKYMQGMIALALNRTGDVQTAKNIIASLKQNAISDEEKGMYWKGMEEGYYWYNAPIETQSLLIEAFREIGGDAAIDRALKTWLLKQKQTHHWATTTATADACYALLLGGQDWLNADRSVELKLGDKTVDFAADAGAGYNKKVFDGAFVNPAMGNITVTVKGGSSPAWGAVYWQYFDMLDRITPPGGKAVLNIGKRLFLKRNTDRGPVLDSLVDNGTLKPGDQVVVRVELRADRDLQYVHMKDMRAACMEPLDVISGYRWQDGLGYYESTKDVSTEFFFDLLPRGTHVFEYGLTVGQAGNFSNGITSIECMYAPEFSYHSEGIRMNVEAAP